MNDDLLNFDPKTGAGARGKYMVLEERSFVQKLDPIKEERFKRVCDLPKLRPHSAETRAQPYAAPESLVGPRWKGTFLDLWNSSAVQMG